MTNIRRQSIISSLIVYAGFVVGFLNTYLFTKQGPFSETDYGLTTIFIAITTMMMAVAAMATPSYIFKFHPYYEEHVPPRKNDMITWALLVSFIGFLLVMGAGIIFKDVVVRKYSGNAPQLIHYYYWLFPMGLGLTIYTVLEAYAWSRHESVFTIFLREVQWKLFTTVLIVLVMLNVIPDFSLFIKLYSFGYPCIALILLGRLIYTKQIHFTLTVSKVTRRFFRYILLMCGFYYGGTIIVTLSQVFDYFVIASVLPNGIDQAGIFGFAMILSSLIQAPQRAIVAAAVPHLSKAWKDKNMGLLQRVYHRSSINQLLFASAIFLLIWMNFNDAIATFRLKPAYYEAAWPFFLLGFTKIVDMGTGVNAQIISTSTRWKFELQSGIILLIIMLPLTYLLTRSNGLTGPAIATLISITIYNIIRIIFLWQKFRLYPFSKETGYTILLAAACYGICWLLFHQLHGLTGMTIRSMVFIALFATGTIYMKLSPDINPVIKAIRGRLGFRRS